MPTVTVRVPPPPDLERGDGASGALLNAIPMLGSLGSILLVTSMATRPGADHGRAYLAAGMFLVTTVGFVVVQLVRQRGQRSRQVGDVRTDYLHQLATARSELRDAAERQRAALRRQHPDPDALPALAAARSPVWTRGPDHPGFLEIRHGLTTQPLAVELDAPAGTTPHRTDPVAATARERLLACHAHQPRLPAVLHLAAARRIVLDGDEEPARATARALVCSAVLHHSPDHLVVAVLASARALTHWEWLKWLPHARSATHRDAVGPRRLVATDADELTELLADDPRHRLLVTDGVVAPEIAGDGVSVLDVASIGERAEAPGEVRLSVAGADRCSPATAEALARRLAPLRSGTSADRTPAAPPPVLDLDTLGPTGSWRPGPPAERLRVPIGVDDDGRPVHLDLKEAAQRGMGPHGLLVGATGSGKSELLRTLVLGLAARQSPDRLNLVLVDFKGGATFAGLAALPHVSALITNLAAEVVLVERMQDALSGELLRRQELLRAAGEVASIADYEISRAGGADLPPLPSLVVVVDEFSELLAARPELIDLFVAIGRLGRSLGIHLLLASQRIDEGRLRGLESHLSYRIGLRTFSAAESLAVLGVRDAHELPPVPGLGYLRTDSGPPVRFRAAYVSAPAPVRRPVSGPPRTRPFCLTGIEPEPDGEAPEPAPDRPSLLEEAVDRLAGHGPPAHRVWLPPLDAPDTIEALLGDLAVDPGLGLVSHRWRDAPGLTVPLGTLDLPREQRRAPLTVDLTAAGGHVAVVGGPRSGKTTVLRTLVSGLALTTTPLETQVFVLDLGGGFGETAGLPHVSGAATRAEPKVVRRILAEVASLLGRREAHFREHGVESVEDYRNRYDGGGAGDGYGDVLLVVDGWETLRDDHESVDSDLLRLAVRGAGYGIHLVVSTSRWSDLRPAMRDVFGTRLELRLGDPMDSQVDRRAAATVPLGRPGRGLDAGGRHFLAALPRLDDGDLVERVTSAWAGPDAPRLRLLPDHLALTDLRAGSDVPGLLLGVDEHDLAPVALDPASDAHLVVLGDGGSGRTALLRCYLREVVRTHSPDRAQVVVVDYRRTLQGEVPSDFLLDHLASEARATPALRDLAAHLTGRLPGEEVTAGELRRRQWWTGPEVFVMVDDQELVATSLGSPVSPLLPLLAQARDVGLHLVVARRTGGASRAMYEPVLQALRDLAVPAVLLSGSPDEGPLVAGLRPEPLPPGRGRLVTRDGGVRMLQTAWTDPAA